MPNDIRPKRTNRHLWRAACKTEGWFEPEEAALLASAILKAPSDARILEIGSYKGRSTLFILSAMRRGQQLVSVDAFINTSEYGGHSPKQLAQTIKSANKPVTFHTLRTEEAARRCDKDWAAHPFSVVLVDGDHRYKGVSADLAIAAAYGTKNVQIFCHDHDEKNFPGVFWATQGMVTAGVLSPVKREMNLQQYKVLKRPAWLTSPIIYKGPS